MYITCTWQLHVHVYYACTCTCKIQVHVYMYMLYILQRLHAADYRPNVSCNHLVIRWLEVHLAFVLIVILKSWVLDMGMPEWDQLLQKHNNGYNNYNSTNLKQNATLYWNIVDYSMQQIGLWSCMCLQCVAGTSMSVCMFIYTCTLTAKYGPSHSCIARSTCMDEHWIILQS